MTLLQSGLAKSLAADAYTIDNSLRWNSGDSATLTRTPGTATSNRIGTLSWWMKLGDMTDSAFGLSNYLDEGNRTSISTAAYALNMYGKVGGTASRPNLNTSQLFRDPSAWYHIVYSIDVTQSTASDRIKLYVNGEQVTSFSSETYPDQNVDFPLFSKANMLIGARYAGSIVEYTDGYMAEFYYIDGTALAASSFGELSSTTNQWIPIDAVDDLTFGTNGFYQKYGSTELADSFTDSSAGLDTFTTAESTTWTAPAGVTSVSYLVVAGGGGGGGGYYCAAGGAGGYLTGTLSVTPESTYTVTVGAGGAGGAGYPNSGSDGGDSVFSSITSDGGGGGGHYTGISEPDASDPSNGRPGGSGGGGNGAGTHDGLPGGAGGAATAGQGYDGGVGYFRSGGGGGGASEVGAVGSDSSTTGIGGAGGDGLANSISGTSVTYAGGGGGGGSSNTSSAGVGGSGGSGGGGDGASGQTAVAQDGTANTGGGGGGASFDTGSYANGGDGGSGIVILNYQPGTGFHTITANGDVTNTRAVRKIGDSSIALDGTGDYLSTPSSGLALTGDFTIEFWFYTASTTSDNGLMSNNYNDSGTDGNFSIRVNDGGINNNISYRPYNGTVAEGGMVETTNSVWSDNTWTHCAVVKDGSGTGNVKIYIDGTNRASVTTIGESSSTMMGNASTLNIGAQLSHVGNNYINGYMDEIRISDSARYTGTFTPSTTAFTADANTKLLIHSNWDGGLGADSSGNYNTFTATNLVATDQMIDTPTNSFCTINPLSTLGASITIGEGNLYYLMADDREVRSTFAMFPGTKWYWEYYNMAGPHTDYAMPGIANPTDTYVIYSSSSDGVCYYASNGYKYVGGAGSSAYGASFTEDDIIGIALNLVDDEITYYKNGVSQGAITGIPTPALWVPAITNPATSAGVFNFGQDSSFAGNATAQGNQDDNGIGDFYYDVPAGFLAPCTDNLSDPEIALPGENFSANLWLADDASPRTLTGFGHQSDFVWVKHRGSASVNHTLVDTLRGGEEMLASNTTAAEDPGAHGKITSWNADGITVADGTSATYPKLYFNDLNPFGSGGGDYVGWSWKAGGAPTVDNDNAAGTVPDLGSVMINGVASTAALAGTMVAKKISANTTNGFSIVEYTGHGGTTGTVPHCLGVKPDLIITKYMSGAASWSVYNSPQGATKVIWLDDTSAEATGITYWRDTEPTSTVFSVGASGTTGGNANPYIAYCFNNIEGYSKVGSYEGNNTTDNVMVYTGFRPAFVLIKCLPSATTNWGLFDNKREGYNVDNDQLQANTNIAETTTDFIDIVSNGFKVRSAHSDVGSGSEAYLYYAVAESPFKYSNAR